MNLQTSTLIQIIHKYSFNAEEEQYLLQESVIIFHKNSISSKSNYEILNPIWEQLDTLLNVTATVVATVL